jgi:hypothetical protein
LYRLDVSKREWTRLGEQQPSPQNLYERTSLVYDPNSNQVLLNGGGAQRNELWSFDLKQKLWKKLAPRVISSNGAQPPASGREAVFLPRENVMLSYAASTKNLRQWTLWAYRPAHNTWEELNIAGQGQSRMGWNDALVYDPIHDVVLWVAGKESDNSKADVYALRFKSQP